MVHFKGFLAKVSRITGIPETEFPILENYIGDYNQLGFYYSPVEYFVITDVDRQKRLTGARIVGGFTLHSKSLPKTPKAVMFINLYSLFRGSQKIEFIPYPVLYASFKKLVNLFNKFWLHEYLHLIGISDRGIRALRKMGLDV